MRRPEIAITFTCEERESVNALVRTRTAPYGAVQRARVVMLAAQGLTNTAISQQVGLSRSMVVKWRKRFATERLAGLKDRPRHGGNRVYTDEQRAQVLATVCGPPPQGAIRWTVRNLAEHTGVGRQSVHRILRAERLAPVGSRDG